MAEYIIGDIYYDDGSTNWFAVPSIDDLDDEYERITRCRDCKHYMESCAYHHGEPACLRCASEADGFDSVSTEPNGFCKWGEPNG